MVSTTKTQQKQVAQINIQEMFLNYVKANGYTVKSYNQLSEQSVQINGRIKMYFVTKRNGALKLCLPLNFPIDKTPENVVKSIPEGKSGFTYPQAYPVRLDFKANANKEMGEFLQGILEELLPKQVK